MLDFYRSAMVPMGPDADRAGHRDDLDEIRVSLTVDAFKASVADWDLDAYRQQIEGGGDIRAQAGQSYARAGRDSVSCAPSSLASLNVAAVHHDRTAGGSSRRLVYGGHTIGLAFSHLARTFPDLATVVAWRSCDHVAPVYEYDLLSSVVRVEAVEPLACGGALATCL